MVDQSKSIDVKTASNSSFPVAEELVRVENLKKYFPVQTGFLAKLTKGEIPS